MMKTTTTNPLSRFLSFLLILHNWVDRGSTIVHSDLSMKRCYLKRVKLKLKKNRKIWMYIMLSLSLEYVARVVGCEQVYHERLETVPSLTPRYHHRRPHHLLSLAGGQAGGQGDFVVHSRPDTRPLLVKNSAFLICRASWRPLYSAGIYYIVGYRNICYWTH